jgi:hemin uptake protein HemP
LQLAAAHVLQKPAPGEGRFLANTDSRLEPLDTGRSPPARRQASELLAGRREVILEHGGQEYRLRLTSNGKLILTK